MKHNVSRQNCASLGRTACLFFLAALVAILAGCSSGKSDPASTKVVETNADPDVFTMPDPSQFSLAAAQVRKVSDEVHVTCAVTPEVNLSVPVVSLGGGRVVEIKARLGDTVKKGQVLLLIDSPDLSAAFSDYEKFKADEALSDPNFSSSRRRSWSTVRSRAEYRWKGRGTGGPS